MHVLPYACSICCSLLLLSSCQSYRERPLALQHRIQHWAAQDPAYVAQHVATPQANNTFDLTDGIQIAEAEAIALFFNPQLRQTRVQNLAHQADAAHAGTWSDPELGVDGAYILEEVDDQVLGGVTLGFSIPLSGRKRVAADLAAAALDESKQAIIVAEWALIQNLRQQWCRASALEKHIRLSEAFLQQLKQFQTLTADLLDAQLLQVHEAQSLTLFQQRNEQNLIQLRAEFKALQLAITSLLGLHPKHQWRFSFQLPQVAQQQASAIAPEQLIEHPQIKQQSLQYLVAEQALHLEIRKQYPDLHFGFGLASEDGQTRSTFGLGLAPLAVWNRNRQGIKRAQINRTLKGLEAEQALRDLIYRHEQLQNQLQKTNELLAFIRQQQLPLAEQQLASVRQAIKLGDINILLIIESLSNLFELQAQEHQLITEQQQQLIALDGLRVPFSQEEQNHE